MKDGTKIVKEIKCNLEQPASIAPPAKISTYRTVLSKIKLKKGGEK